MLAPMVSPPLYLHGARLPISDIVGRWCTDTFCTVDAWLSRLGTTTTTTTATAAAADEDKDKDGDTVLSVIWYKSHRWFDCLPCCPQSFLCCKSVKVGRVTSTLLLTYFTRFTSIVLSTVERWTLTKFCVSTVVPWCETICHVSLH